MRSVPVKTKLQVPALATEAQQINDYLRTLNVEQLAKSMKISEAMAKKTHLIIQDWSQTPAKQSLALDCFIGDIYSGLQAPELTPAQRDYANQTLYILSGLYGVIRPFDGIMPYRLEMAYKFPDPPFDNLYKFWGQRIAKQLPESGLVANLSSVEYSKTVLPIIDTERVIAPQFFTVNPKTKLPTFVTVHSKIARGAFARWLITTQTQTAKQMEGFDLLGYKYDKALSLPNQPAFVAQEFGGIGLSIRLQ